MKIVMIVSDSWLFKPEFAERIFLKRARDIAFVALNPAKFKHLTWKDIIYKHWILLGSSGFFIYSLLTVMYSCFDMFSRYFPFVTPRSVQTVASRYNIDFAPIVDINSRSFLEKLREIKPDIILNVSNQIYKKEILDIPSRGCINQHYALLPRYGGMYPFFWALLNGEKEVGVTIHYMNDQIDAGDIIRQESIPVKSSSTAMGLWKECNDLAIELTLKTLDDIEHDRVQPRPMSGEKSYFSFPGKEDMIAFKKKGLKVW